jgi:hypothetical protein
MTDQPAADAPLLYTVAAAECERDGHQFKRWAMPDGSTVRALCANCGRTFDLAVAFALPPRRTSGTANLTA